MYGQFTILLTLMLQGHIIAFGLLLNPGPVFVDVGGVNDQKETVVGHFVDQQVVYHPTLFIAHHAIEYFSSGNSTYIVGKNVVDIAFGVTARNEHFAHVAHIKYATVLTYSLMFIDNAAILYGHVEPSEG